jgi:hypothetical protein
MRLEADEKTQAITVVEPMENSPESSKDQGGDRLENASKANVLLQAKRLKASPVISKLIEEKN